MSKKFMFVALMMMSLAGTSVFADSRQTAGGWGQDCQSGNVTCSSGRVIWCNATAIEDNRSECTQHFGDVAWVNCRVFDRDNNIIDQSKDACP